MCERDLGGTVVETGLTSRATGTSKDALDIVLQNLRLPNPLTF